MDAARTEDSRTEQLANSAADVSPVIAALRETIAALMLDNEALRTKLAERDVPPPIYLPLKRAAGEAFVRYDRARVWHRKGLIESRKDAGRIVATVSSLIERRVMVDAK
jgi:hypothetical protein